MSRQPHGHVLRYHSGEDIREGDRVTYGGNPGVVELVIGGPSGEDTRDWHFRTVGAGILVTEPRVFGRVYLHLPHEHEDLLLVARAE